MALPIPVDSMLDFLVRLLNTPSPTGDTARALAVCEEAFTALGLTARHLRKGGLILTWEADPAHPRALTAHTDTLGAIVRAIKSNGRLQLSSIGSFDWHSIETEGCTVMTRRAKPIAARYCLSRPRCTSTGRKRAIWSGKPKITRCA